VLEVVRRAKDNFWLTKGNPCDIWPISCWSSDREPLSHKKHRRKGRYICLS
jgi:hypothetical protein